MKRARHLEESLVVSVSPEAIFVYADNHANFSAHMNQSNWMMDGFAAIWVFKVPPTNLPEFPTFKTLKTIIIKPH